MSRSAMAVRAASTAPDLTVLNGKMLRIDPHGASPDAYGIPPDNPYAASGTARHEIWSYGFRNPCRFSVDHLDRGPGHRRRGPVDLGGDRPRLGFHWTRPRRQLRLAELRGLRHDGHLDPLHDARCDQPGLRISAQRSGRRCRAWLRHHRRLRLPGHADRRGLRSLPLRRPLHRRAPLDPARAAVRFRRPGGERPGCDQPQLLRRGRELQPVRDRRQCRRQDRRIDAVGGHTRMRDLAGPGAGAGAGAAGQEEVQAAQEAQEARGEREEEAQEEALQEAQKKR